MKEELKKIYKDMNRQQAQQDTQRNMAVNFILILVD